jgi:hypothetical protein
MSRFTLRVAPGHRLAFFTLAILSAAILSIAVTLLGSNAGLPGPAKKYSSPQTWGALPLAFEQNHGQTAAAVDYMARGKGYVVFLTPTAATLSLRGQGGNTYDALRMTLAGANRNLSASPEKELPGKVNYLIGNDPAQWKIDLPEYSRVNYRGVYPGVDLVYYGNQGTLEYDFVVQPNADAGSIALQMHGAQKLSTGSEGDLELQLSGGSIAWKRPVAYQLRDGQRQQVAADYTINGDKVGFRLGAYDHNTPLVVDPALTYGTYIGVSDGSIPGGIAVDSSHNVYITGAANSAAYPVTAGAYQTTYGGGGQDVFITKLSADGSSLIYSTYLGGSGPDGAAAIAVDASGNAYVVGNTNSSNFPVTSGAMHLNSGSNVAGFITKLNSTGSSLIYSAEIGVATLRGIAIDSAGDAYVTGAVFGTPFQTTTGAYKTTIGTTNCPNVQGESYVLELNPAGSAPVYSTYVSDCEQAYGIAIQNGEAYITGQTENHHPVTPGAFQQTFGGYIDSFVTKLNTAGSALVYSSYLGGDSGDNGNAIGVDSSGNAIVAGATASPNFPVANAFQSTLSGTLNPNDASVTKFNSTGSALVYSTYLGGQNYSFAQGLALDSSGNAFVAGNTGSADFPTMNAFQGICGGSNFTSCVANSFVSEFSPAGAFLASTYYGPPTSWAYGNAVATDSLGNAYVVGQSDAGLPTTSNAYEKTTTSNLGAVFTAKISMNTATGCTNLRQNRTVAICMPFTGSTSGTFVRVSAVVNDSNPVSAIQVYVDGTFVFEEDLGNQIDSYVQMSAGTHTLAVKAWDKSGSFLSTRSVKVSGTDTASCTVGEILPYVQICTPEAGSSSSNPVHVHALGASQNTPVTAMRLYVDGFALDTVQSSTLDTSATLATGRRKVTVQAWDWKGQTFKQNVYVTVP